MKRFDAPSHITQRVANLRGGIRQRRRTEFAERPGLAFRLVHRAFRLAETVQRVCPLTCQRVRMRLLPGKKRTHTGTGLGGRLCRSVREPYRRCAVTEVRRLHRHAPKDMAISHVIAAGAGKVQTLYVILLRPTVLSLIHCHPPSQVTEKRRGRHHRIAGFARRARLQVGSDRVHQECGGHWAGVSSAEFVIEIRQPIGHCRYRLNFGLPDTSLRISPDGFHSAYDIGPARNGERYGEKPGTEKRPAGRVHVRPPQINQTLHGTGGLFQVIGRRRKARLTRRDRAMESSGQRFENERPGALLGHVPLQPLVNRRLPVLERRPALGPNAVDRLGELTQRPPALAVQPLKRSVRLRRAHWPQLPLSAALKALKSCRCNHSSAVSNRPVA